jgi:hypothetical protein
MPILVEWPDSSLIKVVESSHLPYVKTYRVTTDFSTRAEALDFINSINYRKSSGIDGDAGDWTKSTDPTLSRPALPTQAQADKVASEAKAEEDFETVHYKDGSSASGPAPLPRVNSHGSPAV